MRCRNTVFFMLKKLKNLVRNCGQLYSTALKSLSKDEKHFMHLERFAYNLFKRKNPKLTLFTIYVIIN